MRDRRLLEPHELPVLVLGVLCGVSIAVAAVWFLLHAGIVDELDPLGAPIALGMLVGGLIGVVLVTAARRARL